MTIAVFVALGAAGIPGFEPFAGRSSRYRGSGPIYGHAPNQTIEEENSVYDKSPFRVGQEVNSRFGKAVIRDIQWRPSLGTYTYDVEFLPRRLIPDFGVFEYAELEEIHE